MNGRDQVLAMQRLMGRDSLHGYRVGDRVAFQRPDGRVYRGSITRLLPPSQVQVRTLNDGLVTACVHVLKRRSEK